MQYLKNVEPFKIVVRVFLKLGRNYAGESYNYDGLKILQMKCKSLACVLWG